MDAAFAPIQGASAWHGAQLIKSPSSWHWQLSATEIDALERATASIRTLNLAPPDFGPELFAVPELAPLFNWVAEQLETGPGFVRISGLPTRNVPAEDLQRLFWGVCANVGAPIYQTVEGEVLSEIKDETGSGVALSYNEPGPVKSSRNISRSPAALRFHTDRCDVLSLFCVSNATKGGETKLVSSIAIHDEIARRRPDLLRVLYRPYWHLRALTDNDVNDDPVFEIPIFGRGPNGQFASQYSRNSITQAQDIESVPRLTEDQIEAMNLIATIADEICLQTPFHEGDIQLMNQHITYHGRTAYVDDPEQSASRVLLRVWLSTPFSRALPPGHGVMWGDVRAGALRGGALPGRCAIPAG